MPLNLEIPKPAKPLNSEPETPKLHPPVTRASAVSGTALRMAVQCSDSLGSAGIGLNIGALIIIGIGFWGPLYYKYNKEPPKQYW